MNGWNMIGEWLPCSGAMLVSGEVMLVKNPGFFDSHPNQRDQQDQLTNSFLSDVLFLQMMAAWLVVGGRELIQQQTDFLFRGPHGFPCGR